MNMAKRLPMTPKMNALVIMTDEELRAEYIATAKTLFKGNWFAFRDTAISFDLHSLEEICEMYANARLAGEDTEYLVINMGQGFETFKEAKDYLLAAFRADRNEINESIHQLKSLTEAKIRKRGG